MKGFLGQLKFIFFTIVLAGCAATELKLGADKIRIMLNEPKGCKYLGEVTGNQGNFFTGVYTSNENLETGARNDLKNKALEKGANAMVFLTNRAGSTSNGGRYGYSGSQTNVTLTATIYNCPDSVLNN